MRFDFCPECGGQVNYMFVDYIVKECHGPGYHIIGWNGQLWIPAVRDFCLWYGLTQKEIEKKQKEREKLTEEVVNS